MTEPCRVSFRDGRLASLKAEEAARRRFQAVSFLESMLGPLQLSPQPSELDFVSSLRNGIILCHAINKIQPGAVPKVVTNQSLGLTWETKPLPAYQYFENVRNFLRAVHELKLPTFEASDLERDTLDIGSASKIVDCILALKTYYELKQATGNSVHSKSAKSSFVPQNPQSLDSSILSEKQQQKRDENLKSQDSTTLLVRALADCMSDSEESIQNILETWRSGSLDPLKELSKLVPSFLEDYQLNSASKGSQAEENSLEYKSSVSQSHKRCSLCMGKENCNHWFLLEAQENELSVLKALLSRAKEEFTHLQCQVQDDLRELGTQIQVISNAALRYHQAVQENRHLYNVIQELKGNIRVFCRVRPSFCTEAKTTIDHMASDGSLIIIDPLKAQSSRKIFRFNKVFGPNTSQDEVYKETQPLIRSVLDGFNVCIFAYGQTGSGKTHTMSGSPKGSEKEMGINHRALSDLFQISSCRDDIKYEIRVQMVEIYNEQIRDLLLEDASMSKLEIRTYPDNGVALPDASMHYVGSCNHILKLMKLGENNRVASSTTLNHRSSRSHSILTVHVFGRDASGSTIQSCLHLVDLAGSERIDKSEVTGDRLKEAQHINKSLSCLGDVIAALAQKNAHIPYRNSKLTQLLQNSLGGHAKMLMFAHVSPEVDSYGETISTLKFAQRASTVELGIAQVNKESDDIRDLKEKVESLKKALAAKEETKMYSSKMKENKPVDNNIGMTDNRTPPRPRRLSIENGTSHKSRLISNTEGLLSKSSLSRIAQPERTPPRPRRLSIENSNIIRNGMVSRSPVLVPKQVNHTPPCARRLSIENANASKSGTTIKHDVRDARSSLPKLNFATGSTGYSRRLSLGGANCEVQQQQTKYLEVNNHTSLQEKTPLKESMIHLQVTHEAAECRDVNLTNETAASNLYEDLSCQQLKTPISMRKLDKTATPKEARKSHTKTLSANNSKGSQIRKSLLSIGRLINGSEKRSGRSVVESSQTFSSGKRSEVSSSVTADSRLRRRQSLTGVHDYGSNVSRRSSLGGKSVGQDTSNTQVVKASTSIDISKATKKWL